MSVAHDGPAERLRADELWQAIDSLPDKLRVVIVLANIEGHSVADVGSLLRVPSGTVVSRYQGDELVSSLPYFLALTREEGSGSNMSIGAEVPVLQIAPVVNAEGEPLPGVGRGGPFTYRHVTSAPRSRASSGG